MVVEDSRVLRVEPVFVVLLDQLESLAAALHHVEVHRTRQRRQGDELGQCEAAVAGELDCVIPLTALSAEIPYLV